MAREGLRFTHGYANSPVCSPTRFALDDRRATSTGCAAPPRSRSPAASARQPDARPAARRIRPCRRCCATPATRTALIGKWHLGYPPHFGPLKIGYEEFFGPMCGRRRLLHATATPRGKHDLYDGEDEVHADGLPHRPDLASARSTFVERADRARRSCSQPALHRAALALGDARRRSASPRRNDNLFHLDGGNGRTPTAA